MHPLLARFLDASTALSAARRAREKQPLSDDERLYARVLTRDPDRARALLSIGGHASPEAQQALVFFAAHAAVEALRGDPQVSPALTRADLALRGHGGSDQQVAAYLASIVIEEGFGYEDSPDSFDRAFLIETLESVPALLGAEPITVDRIVEGYTSALPKARRSEAERRARTLLQTAWEDEPEPINPDHVEAALEDGSAEDARELGQFLSALAKEGFIGPRRLARLFEFLGLEG
jgi:hypothetical protein